MKRSIFLLSGLVVISTALFVFLASGIISPKADAQSDSPYGDRPATLDLDNAYHPPMVYADEVKVENKSGKLQGTFSVINDTDETVSDIGYRIDVFGDPLGMEGSGDQQVLFGRLQSAQVMAMLPKEKKEMTVDMALPALPTGAYTVQVQILQTGGRKLGWGRAPLVVEKGSSDFAYLYEQAIVLPEFDNKEVNPLTGPNVDPSGSLVFTAQAEVAAGSRTVTPVLEWHEFDDSRPVADTVSFDAVTLKAGQLSPLSLNVSAPSKPGVYLGILTLRDGKRVLSTLGEYRVVVRGKSADLISARLASVATKKGETAFARIDYVGSADAETRGQGQLTVELLDSAGVAGKLSVPSIRLTDGVGRGTARIELSRDLASEPRLHVVIADDAGVTLRDATVPVSLTAEQIDSLKSRSTFALWASWYLQPYYLGFAFVALTVLLCLGFMAHAVLRNLFSMSKSFRSASAAAMVAVLLFMQSPFAFAFGGSNGIEVFAPITVGENENQTLTDKAQYRAYWGEIYAQPAVAIFVNRPIHNSTYQCNTPIPLEYRVDFAACNNMPSGGRVLAHFDLNQNFQSTLLGTNANWVKVYDQVYTQAPSCNTKACIHSYSQNTTINLNTAGLPSTATKTTLRVVVKHNPYLDGNVAFPNDTVSYSDFYFQWRVAQAFNIWLNFVCAQPKADVQIVKTAVTPTVNRGNQASYGITVRNNGPDAANTVTVTDAIPSGLTFVSSSDNRCTQNGNNIVCNFGTMASGAQISATFTFQTSVNTVCGNVPNTAVVNNAVQDDNLSNNQSTATVQVVCPLSADVQITKAAATPTINRGDMASYTLTVRNNGPDIASNVVVTDPIPAGVTFVSASDNRCSQQGSNIVCNLGNFASGSQVQVTLNFQTSGATACGQLPNVANVSTTTAGDNPNNNQSSATITVNCPVVVGCIDILKEAFDPSNNQLSVVPQFTFTLDGGQTYVNDSTGRVRINNVTPGNHTITETISSGWQQIQVTPSNGVVSVAAGSQCAGIVFKNKQVLPTLDLTILKTAPATIVRGNTLFYTVTVTNSGPATANNVVVTDQVPSGLIYLPGSSDAACSLNGSTVSCQLGTMAQGSRTLTLAFTVPTVQNCSQTTISNTAVVSTSSTETNTGNNQSTATTTVTCPPPQTGCIDVVKEVYDPNGNLLPVVPQFTFTLDGNQTVVNDASGNARFSNVSVGSHTVTEALSSGWQQILVTPANGTVSVASGTQCAAVVFKNRQVIQATPDVSIVKAGPASVTAGNTLTYTLTVFNGGNAAANNVSVTDAIPSGLTFLPGSSDTSCSQQGSSVVCSLGTLNAGSSRAIVLGFSVPSSLQCTQISNQASVGASNDGNNNNNTSGTVLTQVSCSSSSSSSSSSAPAQTGCIDVIKTTLNTQGNVLTPTAQFTFTLDGSQTAVNDSTGRARFNNVSVGTHTVSETVPSGWTQTSVSPTNGIVSVFSSPNNASCAQVYVLNQQNSVQTNADMAIVKTGPSSVQRGTNFTYQLAVTNNGPQAATNVVVTDSLPSELIYLPGSSDSRCVLNGQTVTCQLGTMTSGQSTTITIGVTSNYQGGNSCSQATVTNRATVTSSTPDSNQSNNSSQMNTTLTCPNVVTFCPNVTVDADDNEVDAGDEIDYEIRVRNNTNQSQTFDLTAFLDRDTDFVDANGGGDDNGHEVEWNNVYIGANDTKVLDLTVETDSDLNDGDSVRLRVETDCDSDSVDVDINGERIARGEANLTIDKSVDRNEALPGDVLSYTLTIRNTGSDSVNDVVVDDVHTSNRLTIFSAPGGTISGNAIHWNLGTMSRGAVRILHYTASVSLDAQNGDMIPNTATVRAPGQYASDSELVRVIRTLPQTGAPQVLATLMPIRSNGGGTSGGMPFIASFLVILFGGLGGAFATKRFVF